MEVAAIEVPNGAMWLRSALGVKVALLKAGDLFTVRSNRGEHSFNQCVFRARAVTRRHVAAEFAYSGAISEFPVGQRIALPLWEYTTEVVEQAYLDALTGKDAPEPEAESTATEIMQQIVDHCDACGAVPLPPVLYNRVRDFFNRTQQTEAKAEPKTINETMQAMHSGESKPAPDAKAVELLRRLWSVVDEGSGQVTPSFCKEIEGYLASLDPPQ